VALAASSFFSARNLIARMLTAPLVSANAAQGHMCIHLVFLLNLYYYINIRMFDVVFTAKRTLLTKSAVCPRRRRRHLLPPSSAGAGVP
jgi:hypothetical protein